MLSGIEVDAVFVCTDSYEDCVRPMQWFIFV